MPIFKLVDHLLLNKHAQIIRSLILKLIENEFSFHFSLYCFSCCAQIALLSESMIMLIVVMEGRSLELEGRRGFKIKCQSV